MDILAPDQEVSCSQCKTQLENNQNYCTSCGYPELGTEAERSKFHADRILVNRENRDGEKRLKSARNTLFVIAGLNFIAAIFFFFQMGQDLAVLITYVIIAVIYLVLGYWSQQRPLIALILGLLVYLTMIVLGAILEPSSIFSGIIIKVIIIVYLIKGVNSASKIKS